MALNIKDPETDRLVRELAAATGESITVATRRAVEDRLERVGRRPTPSSGLAAIITRGRARTRPGTSTCWSTERSTRLSPLTWTTIVRRSLPGGGSGRGGIQRGSTSATAWRMPLLR
jgi:antitoxin VapB